jgi:hypothetical protein
MKTHSPNRFAIVAVTAAAAWSVISAAHAETARTGAPPAPRNAYFGELHLHTGMSFDAFLMGTRLYADSAYRYARGEEVESGGQKYRRKVPLDFAAVTDHSEYLGQVRLASDPSGPLAATSWGQRLLNFKPEQRLTLVYGLAESFGSGGEEPAELLDPASIRTNWQHQIDAAEAANQPGKFTAFVGYEWSSLPNGANLHRNVIFRGPNYPEVPFSSVDSAQPEKLWQYIQAQRQHGVQALAIPHNSNVSDGLMFSYADSNREPINREYAETRAGIERLVEISQTKGTSETRPELSPGDEFAGFELIDNLLTVPRPSSIHGSYVREALGRGLELEQRVGVNPFAFGFTGSTDFHNALSNTDEQVIPQLRVGLDVQKILKDAASLGGTRVSAAGLTGVWAEANTRESIYDALYRRETFATSGTRVRVRLFAGYDYAPGVTKRRDWIQRAYAGGVPQGADLTTREAAAPRFLVHAIKDPDSGNLDRVQIVKVWLADGKAKERVFDVLWAGDRRPDADGKLPALRSTVNVDTATYANDTGATELTGEWQDPEFSAETPAVYYARVLEIPTPRWTTYLAVANKLPLPTSVPPTIQERAWTSPIYFKPREQP